MTNKERLLKARLMASRIKGIADRLEYDARDYDVRFPLEYARDLRDMADDLLKK